MWTLSITPVSAVAEWGWRCCQELPPLSCSVFAPGSPEWIYSAGSWHQLRQSKAELRHTASPSTGSTSRTRTLPHSTLTTCNFPVFWQSSWHLPAEHTARAEVAPVHLLPANLT